MNIYDVVSGNGGKSSRFGMVLSSDARTHDLRAGVNEGSNCTVWDMFRTMRNEKRKPLRSGTYYTDIPTGPIVIFKYILG